VGQKHRTENKKNNLNIFSAQKKTNACVEKYFFCVEKNKCLRRKIFFLLRKMGGVINRLI